MTTLAIELNLYMGSSKEIIKWLEEDEGVKTKKEALDKLQSYVKSNVYTVASHIGAGHNVSLAGTAMAIEQIVKHFERKEKEAEL